MAPLKRRRGSTPKQARLAAVAMQGACGPHTHLTADQENSRCSSRGDALVTGPGEGGGRLHRAAGDFGIQQHDDRKSRTLSEADHG